MARNGFAAMAGGPQGLSAADMDYIMGRDGATGGDPSYQPAGRGRRFSAPVEAPPQLRGTIDETAPRLRGTLGPDDSAMGARAPVEAMGKAPSRGGGGGLRGVPEGMKTGIAETAKALGINPLDLATVISYETAGTFNPTKAGPTTQWGQHRGLIQFGEPQARKFGVDWKNPMQSQLGANGAIVKYLQDAGVRPGMGLMDVYSAINAGGVGRNNRSDAGNGGAPGTVADKVNYQMAGHRAKAQRMFGSDPMATATVTQPRQRQVEQPANMAPPEEMLQQRPYQPPQQQVQPQQMLQQQPYQPPPQQRQPQEYYQPIQMPQNNNAFASLSGGGEGGGFIESLFGGGGGGSFWDM